MRILVVDDEPSVREAVRRALGFEGYDVDLAGDGIEALELLANRPADALIVDVLMPRLDGISLCERIRGSGDRVPILMLTARETVTDRVIGLDAGADDYLVKPFALQELLARLRAILRRSTAAPGAGPFQFADLTVDPLAYEARRGERVIELTRTEFLLLELFARNPRRLLPRALIFEQVWGYDVDANSNSLDVYIGYLRRKTEAGGEPRLIHTIRGVGYVMREQ